MKLRKIFAAVPAEPVKERPRCRIGRPVRRWRSCLLTDREEEQQCSNI